MLHIAVQGKFCFGSGGVTNVISRIHGRLHEKIVFDYLMTTPMKNREYAEAIAKISGGIIELKRGGIPVLRDIAMIRAALRALSRGGYSVCYINSSAVLSMFSGASSPAPRGFPSWWDIRTVPAGREVSAAGNQNAAALRVSPAAAFGG